MKIRLIKYDSNLDKTGSTDFAFYPKGDDATLYDEVCQYVELKGLYDKGNEYYDFIVLEEA